EPEHGCLHPGGREQLYEEFGRIVRRMRQEWHHALFTARTTGEPAMNRFQKKCFIVSMGLHLLLAVILIVGPAFLSSRGNEQAVTPIDFIPVKVVEGAITGGGNPNANPPPPAPPAPPTPVTPPPQQAKVEQPKDVPKPDPIKIEKSAPTSKPAKS